MDCVPDIPCWLLMLPHELLFNTVDNITHKRDLYNLSRTCHALENVCLRRLYAQVDIQVSRGSTSSWKMASEPVLRPHVIRVMKELRVRNGAREMRNSFHSGTRKLGASTVVDLVGDTVGQLPMNQLQAFAFLQTSPMNPGLLQVLATNQCQSLRGLSLYEFADSTDESDNIVLPNKLQLLEIHSVQDGRAAGNLVSVNRASLEHLRLGQERELTRQYNDTRIGFLDHGSPSPGLFRSVSLAGLPSLRQLELCGVDVAPLMPLEVEDALFFCNFTRLSLESCPGSANFLQCLANTFHTVQETTHTPNARPPIQLREFVFRSEAPTTQLKESLLFFLDSFSGLTTMSLLFENASILERVSTFLCEHGPTIHTLVLESRIQPRDNLGLDTSRPFGAGGHSRELWEQSIDDICQLCPNLVELGMGFPWGDEVVRLRKTRLPTLPHLRTIHIRNFPENRVLSQIGDYTIKEHATKFVDWVFPTPLGGQKPALETLAIGPTTYESRWMTGATRRRPAEFQRTHYYIVDWGFTRFGRWSPMVSPMSEKYMEEIRGEKPLRGVFEQVWLK